MKVQFVISKDATKGELLLAEIGKQLKNLKIGDVDERKQPPPKGTLSPDPVTIIVTLKIVTWTANAALAIYKLVKEVREKHAADNKVDLKELPPVEIVIEDEGAQISVPASKPAVDKFLTESGAKDEAK